MCPINKTGSSLNIAYVKIKSEPAKLNNQNPKGKTDFFCFSEYNHWYTNRNVKTTWETMPRDNNQIGIASFLNSTSTSILLLLK